MNRHDLRNILVQLGVEITEERHDTKFIAKCPYAPFLHPRGEDRRPSFAAFINDTGFSGFDCKSCHRKGRISYLVRSLAHYRDENLQELALLADRVEHTAAPLSALDTFDRMHTSDKLIPLDETIYMGVYPHAWDYDTSRAYLLRRGVSEQTAVKLELRYDQSQERVLFPVRRGEGLYGFSGRAIYEGASIRVKDYLGLQKRHFVLGEHLWQAGKPLVIVEGLFAYAHLHEIGCSDNYNIGALLGSSMTQHKAACVKSLDETVYLLLDNDPAGEVGIFGHNDGVTKTSGAVDYLKGFVPVYVPYWVPWRGGEKDGQDKTDPDELTYEEFNYMVKTAKNYS